LAALAVNIIIVHPWDVVFLGLNPSGEQKAEKIRYQPANFNKLTKMIDTVTPVCLVFHFDDVFFHI
jgi:G:T/U-mismatch repair DNA glycosylase